MQKHIAVGIQLINYNPYGTGVPKLHIAMVYFHYLFTAYSLYESHYTSPSFSLLLEKPWVGNMNILPPKVPTSQCCDPR